MSSPIEEYEAFLESIYGVYLDATEGFRYIAQSAHIFINPKTPTPRVRNERGESPAGYVIYALGTQETGDYMELSARTGEEIVANNNEDGANWDFIGRMCIVSAYQLWEDYYRVRIAEYVSIQPDELQIPIFGDLRRLRRCIVHNRSRWADELHKIECFEWEQVTGEPDTEEIHFPKSIISAIWWRMRLALNDLKQRTTGA